MVKKPRERKPQKEANKSYPVKIFALDALRMAEERVKADGIRARLWGLYLVERRQRLIWYIDYDYMDNDGNRLTTMDTSGFFVHIDAVSGEIDIPPVI